LLVGAGGTGFLFLFFVGRTGRVCRGGGEIFWEEGEQCLVFLWDNIILTFFWGKRGGLLFYVGDIYFFFVKVLFVSVNVQRDECCCINGGVHGFFFDGRICPQMTEKTD